MILIISHEGDAHTVAVQDQLRNNGYPFYLLDLSRFPNEVQVALHYDASGYSNSTLHLPDKDISLSDYGAIWWRRPLPFTLHEEIKGGVERSFTYTECQCAISGLLMLADAFWVNHPVKDEVASRKAYQLKVAADCGLRIPKTLISNNAKLVLGFIKSLAPKQVIYKPFSATEHAWRETRLVRPEDLEKIDSLKFAPVIFQECIDADIDLRITIIGDRIFPAAIRSKEASYKFDFRMNYHACEIVPHQLPDEVCGQLLLLMQKLELAYGAVDMRMQPNNEYVFLEVNTAGQWLFTEVPTGMPITATLAQMLIDNDKKR